MAYAEVLKVIAENEKQKFVKVISKYQEAQDINNELINTIIDISSLTNIKILGLMTVGVNGIDNKDNFTKLRKLFLDIDKININNVTMKYLSMGMSNDYLTALECESNMIRIGTKIFGERKKESL